MLYITQYRYIISNTWPTGDKTKKKFCMDGSPAKKKRKRSAHSSAIRFFGNFVKSDVSVPADKQGVFAGNELLLMQLPKEVHIYSNELVFSNYLCESACVCRLCG